MTTNATPLSVVKMILSLSFFNSCKALISSLVMLEGDLVPFWAFFRIFFTSAFSSSAAPCSIFGHTFSIEVIYSSTGGHLGLINFGSQAKSFSSSSVNGLLDRFTTHFLVSSVVACCLHACTWMEFLSV